MWLQFFLEDGHFVVNLLLSLTLFGVGWLYYDAWLANKKTSHFIRVVGFVFLAISFFIKSSQIEFYRSTISVIEKYYELIFPFFHSFGYVFIIISLWLEPIQKKPKLKNTFSMIGLISLTSIFSFFTKDSLMLIYPIMSLIIFYRYLYQSTLGLEDHLKSLSLGFLLISLGEFFSLAVLFRQTNSFDLLNLVVSFGPLWILENLCFLGAAIIFVRWVFGYLLKRFESQMFIILTSAIVLIFFLITILYTGLLFKNFSDQTLNQLETDVKIFQLAVESKKNETLNLAQLIAGDEKLRNSIFEQNSAVIGDTAENYLLAKKQSTLIITDDSGQVLARGENRDKKSDSISDNILIKEALGGKESSSISTLEDVVAPKVSIIASVPIKDKEKIIGVVMNGVVLDNAFIDNIKKTTGLDVSIYAYNQLSASTIMGTDGRSQLIGIKETNPKIKSTVLDKGMSYRGELSIVGVPYLTAFLPLKDKESNVVGMLFVGKPSFKSFETISYTLETTFIAIAILLILSVFPSYYIAKYIEGQLG